MERSEFTESAPGQLVPTTNDRPDTLVAFVPDPLPPNWEWPERLWPTLLEAHKRLASLDGTGKHLPNPEIILRPLQQREAQLSSRLEGTVTDPQQQALFHADPRYPISADDPANAFREVFNYRRALRLGLDGELELPLSLRLIRRLHETLMDGVRGSDKNPGQFRTLQNQIGHPARFVPPPPPDLPAALDAFEKYLHVEESNLDPLVRAFLVHYQFEALHPFADGNGRVGRLLLALTIAEWCSLSSQWLYMSAFFEKRKSDYMDLLLRVSTHGAWNDWIEFCLEGVVVQASDAQDRCDQLAALHRSFHERLQSVSGGSVRLARLADDLFENPTATVTGVRDRLEISYATAKSDLQRLETLGIVQRLEGQSPAAYYCLPIYRVTYAE